MKKYNSEMICEVLENPSECLVGTGIAKECKKRYGMSQSTYYRLLDGLLRGGILEYDPDGFLTFAPWNYEFK